MACSILCVHVEVATAIGRIPTAAVLSITTSDLRSVRRTLSNDALTSQIRQVVAEIFPVELWTSQEPILGSRDGIPDPRSSLRRTELRGPRIVDSSHWEVV